MTAELQGTPSWNALLISVGAYRHHHPVPRAPDAGARLLEPVLADPGICGFGESSRLEDPTSQATRRALTEFLARHGDGDEAMLIYFSGLGRYDFATGRL